MRTTAVLPFITTVHLLHEVGRRELLEGGNRSKAIELAKEGETVALPSVGAPRAGPKGVIQHHLQYRLQS
jgi:hypothetical protein